MDLERFLYNHLRHVDSIGDRLKMSYLVMFSYYSSPENFANLLYTDDPWKLINKMQIDYYHYGINFLVDLKKSSVKKHFDVLIYNMINTYDKDGFYRSVFKNERFSKSLIENSRLIKEIIE